MHAQFRTFGYWRIPYAVTHALCSDGKRRYARITGAADTYFSIPASVKVQGRTVSGFITSHTGPAPDYASDYAFIAVQGRRNSALLPGLV